jgi:hypothetical protein
VPLAQVSTGYSRNFSFQKNFFYLIKFSMKNITQNSIAPILGLKNFKSFSLNPTHEGLLNIARACPNSFIIPFSNVNVVLCSICAN